MFGVDKSRPDGRMYRCKPCHRFMIRGDRPNQKTGPKPVPIEKRFWSKVIKTEGCWKWTGSKVQFGYGKILSKRGLEPAHRVSWRIHYGEIDGKLNVLHKCDNPECNNPEHLFLGTIMDNVRDMINKGRNSRGREHGLAIQKGRAKPKP